MFTSYLIIVATITTAALIWRTLLLDHPRLLAFVESIPMIGGAVRCGFCAAVWLSLIGILFANPLVKWASTNGYSSIPALIISWFTVAAGVLFLRNLIAALMEGTGVLTGLHRHQHENEG